MVNLSTVTTNKKLITSIPEEALVRFYFGDFKIKKKYKSPLRSDKHPSFNWFYTHGGKLYCKDLSTGESYSTIDFIKKLFNALRTNTAIEHPHFGTVSNPIAMMMNEHDAEGERFREIAKLTNNYNPPTDACETYKVTFAMLKEFEQDLHKHIHLENNIVFPKAKEMETKLNLN